MAQINQNKPSKSQFFKKYVFSPFTNRSLPQNQSQLQIIAQEIYEWARNNGAQYASPFAHPFRSQVLQKHNTFLSLQFIKDILAQSIGFETLFIQNLWKQQIDGSSISNGGLRQTFSAKTYLLWDHLSQIFIRKRHKILYIPSFIITPEGNPLDEKMHFRKAEKKLQEAMTKLLNELKIQFNGIFFGVSIEQQFFILPKKFTEKRLDFKYAKRALLGGKSVYSPASDNYCRKIPQKVFKALKQAEQQLLQLGIPIKTHHRQGGVNQFQLCSQVESAPLAIDHNILKMEVLKQACQRNGLQAIFHQKPFPVINGSGKHINFSISYFDKNNKLRNLFDLESQHQQLLVLLILITLKAVQENRHLLVASAMNAGNQIRMGEKQAPLPMVSVSLGQDGANLVEGLPRPQHRDLREKFDFLLKRQKPLAGDRNRTSSIAYSQNRFEFRLPGSSQNPSFPLAVIMTVLLEQINKVFTLLQKGSTLNQITNTYRELSRNVRYEGNNYSQQWIQQAQKRNIYNPNKTTPDFLKDIKTHAKVLIDNQIFNHRQIQAKYKMMKKDYFDKVKIEKDCVLKIVNKHIIPQCYTFISTFPRELHLKNMQKRMKKVDKLLQELTGKIDELQNTKIDDSNRQSAYKVRKMIHQTGQITDKLLQYLPESQKFPLLYNFLDKWENS